jgi:CRISPR-associated protein Cmr1
MAGKITLHLETITPLLMSGANQQPELRAASFRGVLRYWLRAFLGSQAISPQKLFEKESQYFGNTDGGSPLRVRVNQASSQGIFPRRRGVVLPDDQPFTGYKVGFTFDLIFDIHPLCSAEQVFDDHFWGSLLLAINFGAFGKRSRRGGGAVQVTGIDTLDSLSSTAQEIAQGYIGLLQASSADCSRLETHLKNVISKVPSSGTLNAPSYPTFHKDHAQIFLSENGNRNLLKALEPLWEATNDYHDAKGAWGYAKGGRRASAFHIRVHRCTDDNYYPLITVLHSGKGWSNVSGYLNKLRTGGFRLLDDPREDSQ